MEREQIRLMIILRHDQSKTLNELDAHLSKTGFWNAFPPEGAKIISWQVAMGLGHVVTIEISPNQLRSLNLVLEQKAWGAFQTECYVGYDFLPFLDTKR